MDLQLKVDKCKVNSLTSTVQSCHTIGIDEEVRKQCNNDVIVVNVCFDKIQTGFTNTVLYTKLKKDLLWK